MRQDFLPGKKVALSRRAVAIGVGTAVVLWVTALLLWWQADIDKWLLTSQNAWRTNALLVGFAQAATSYGMALIVLVYLLCLLLAFRFERLRELYPVFLMVFLMFGVAGPAGDVLKEILRRPRPSVTYAGEINALSHAATPAFPSGHATKSVALALPFLLMVVAKERWQKGVKFLLAVVALGVCCSRVLLGAHYVSDVLAGVGMALICFPLAAVLTNRILDRMTIERLNVAVRIWVVILLGLMIYLVVR
jgi:membrane-associated phospholipid phosphatase